MQRGIHVSWESFIIKAFGSQSLQDALPLNQRSSTAFMYNMSLIKVKKLRDGTSSHLSSLHYFVVIHERFFSLSLSSRHLILLSLLPFRTTIKKDNQQTVSGVRTLK